MIFDTTNTTSTTTNTTTTITNLTTTTTTTTAATTTTNTTHSDDQIKLDDEIRSRLDNLNALSDLINSLERKFDEANSVFRETLKCSTDRLSSLAKALGTRSIRQARIYHAAKLSVEQSQSDCQKACVQFEQANKDRQFAKKAIQDAESKLKEIAGTAAAANCVIAIPTCVSITDSIDLSKLSLNDISKLTEPTESYSSSFACDKEAAQPSSSTILICNGHSKKPEKPTTVYLDDATISSQISNTTKSNAQESDIKLVCRNDIQEHEDKEEKTDLSSSTSMIKNAAKFSEELNQAIVKLIEAEKKRGLSERQHLDQANKLMIAQENLLKLEREHGPSIRRSQFYFEEAKRFNAKLSSVKGEICRISDDIIAAKQAYAQTLSELERFSDDLHDISQEEKHD